MSPSCWTTRPCMISASDPRPPCVAAVACSPHALFTYACMYTIFRGVGMCTRNSQVDHTHVWRPQPPGLRCHERRDLLPPLPRPAELRLAQASRLPTSRPMSARKPAQILQHPREHPPPPPFAKQAQDCCEPGALPAPALLHDRLRPVDLPWLAAVPCLDGA